MRSLFFLWCDWDPVLKLPPQQVTTLSWSLCLWSLSLSFCVVYLRPQNSSCDHELHRSEVAQMTGHIMLNVWSNQISHAHLAQSTWEVTNTETNNIFRNTDHCSSCWITVPEAVYPDFPSGAHRATYCSIVIVPQRNSLSSETHCHSFSCKVTHTLYSVWSNQLRLSILCTLVSKPQIPSVAQSLSHKGSHKHRQNPLYSETHSHSFTCKVTHTLHSVWSNQLRLSIMCTLVSKRQTLEDGDRDWRSKHTDYLVTVSIVKSHTHCTVSEAISWDCPSWAHQAQSPSHLWMFRLYSHVWLILWTAAFIPQGTQHPLSQSTPEDFFPGGDPGFLFNGARAWKKPELGSFSLNFSKGFKNGQTYKGFVFATGMDPLACKSFANIEEIGPWPDRGKVQPSIPTPKCMWNFQLKRHEENLFFRGPGLKIRNSSISFCFSHFRLNHPFGSIPYSSHPAKAKNTQRETTEAKKKWVKRCTTQEKIDPNHTSELSNF